MKLSKETLVVLKNFASINSGIVTSGDPDGVIKTISSGKNIYATAKLPEVLPKSAFYNLDEFLRVVSIVEDPSFDFGEYSVKVYNNKQEINYAYSDPELIVHPTRPINIPGIVDIKMTVPHNVLKSIIQSAQVLQLPDVCFVSDGAEVKVSCLDLKGASSNKSSIIIDDVQVGLPNKFSVVLKLEFLQKLLAQDYTLEIYKAGIARFSNKELVYVIVLDSSSTYN